MAAGRCRGVILDLTEDEQVIIFRVLPHALAADVFEYLDLEAQQKLLRAMAHEQVVGILNEMSPDDRTALLEELPSAAARQLIRLLTPEERQIAQSLLGYPEGSVGRLMTPDFIAVHEDWTVQHRSSILCANTARTARRSTWSMWSMSAAN